MSNDKKIQEERINAYAKFMSEQTRVDEFAVAPLLAAGLLGAGAAYYAGSWLAKKAKDKYTEYTTGKVDTEDELKAKRAKEKESSKPENLPDWKKSTSTYNKSTSSRPGDTSPVAPEDMLPQRKTPARPSNVGGSGEPDTNPNPYNLARDKETIIPKNVFADKPKSQEGTSKKQDRLSDRLSDEQPHVERQRNKENRELRKRNNPFRIGEESISEYARMIAETVINEEERMSGWEAVYKTLPTWRNVVNKHIERKELLGKSQAALDGKREFPARPWNEPSPAEEKLLADRLSAISKTAEPIAARAASAKTDTTVPDRLSAISKTAEPISARAASATKSSEADKTDTEADKTDTYARWFEADKTDTTVPDRSSEVSKTAELVVAKPKAAVKPSAASAKPNPVASQTRREKVVRAAKQRLNTNDLDRKFGNPRTKAGMEYKTRTVKDIFANPLG